MSIGEDLLVILSSHHGGYRLMRKRIHGYTGPALPKRIQEASESTLRVTLSRLKKKGFVENDKGAWDITESGLKFVAKILKRQNRRQMSSANRKKERNLIIIFDIPEKQRAKRDWLRIELVALGFKMLQQSAWIGLSPLPKEFIEELENLGILQHLKFFEAKESDII